MLRAGAAMQKTVQRQVLTKFLLKLFEENPSGADSLKHETERRIESWPSAACVRSIGLKARQTRGRLGQKLKHPLDYGEHWIGDQNHGKFLGIF